MQRIDGMACCGIYYIPVGTYSPQPLPLLSLNTEITLTPTYSRTVLKQHFKNPSPTDAISEANYVFPLHPTQTITSFTCHVGEDKVLNGIVQSTPKAKATYEAAVSRGETAGLLSYADSDVWQTKLGNVPAGASIEVIITCVAQLQHDSEKDAIRFNLPTYIASRYGAPPQEVYSGSTSYSYRVGPRGRGSWTILRGANNWVDVDGGMSIKVFVQMDSPIKMVEAPAHATNLTMGTHSSSDSSEDFDPKKAVLTLSAETTALDKDFVVLVKTARSGHPSAVVQRHPTKDSASLMVTLVPKFNMPVARPEVVFICDRSGSMSGNEVQLRKALAVFLQSLPVGCKFNICSFGSSHSFLWPKSKAYSEATLKEAQNHVAGFHADMGGTEMFPPVKDAVERRFKDINLELLLLTDGDIWQRDQLMDYVREQCKAKTIRMFTLGIGNGISHALIDGLASIGGGYSQVVQLNEKLDSKVVRMLRAALGQHVSDYTLELSGSAADATPSDEDEYDMLGDAEPQKVVISGKKAELKPEPKKISLFDSSAELDPPPEYESKDTDEARWAHLPPLPELPPKIQSPHVIPPLFSFSRTNAYVVFSPCPKTFPKVAKLQAKTITGDILELEIPILKVDDGKDVSQLAAKSFLQELENGKGYLHEGLLSAQGITKEKHESKWDEIIEREGVRWGEGFGVASKWTSFVAIEDKAEREPVKEDKESEREGQATDLDDGVGGFSRRRMSPAVTNLFGGSSGRSSSYSSPSFSQYGPPSGACAPSPPPPPLRQSYSAQYVGAPPPPPLPKPLPPQARAFGSSPQQAQMQVPNHALQDYKMQLMLLEQKNPKRMMMARAEVPAWGQAAPPPPPPPPPPAGFAFSSSAPPPPPPPGGSFYAQAAPMLAGWGGSGPASFDQDSMMIDSLTAPASSAAPPPARDSSSPVAYAPPPPIFSSAVAPSPGKPHVPTISSRTTQYKFQEFEEDEDEELEEELDTELSRIGNFMPSINRLTSNTNQVTLERRRVTHGSVSKSSRPAAFSRAAAAPRLASLSKSAKMSAPAPGGLSRSSDAEEDEDEDMGCGLFDAEPESQRNVRSASPVAVGTAEERIHGLIMIQSFAGSFSLSDKLSQIIGASFKGASAASVLEKLKELAKTLGVKEDIVATWAAVLVFEKGEGHAAERDTWELVVEKAVMWVEGEGSSDDVKEKVRGVIGA
ncbi:hypothetical protein TWF481_011644 [Arthrobotrys musiformis]|uniref:Uncharacterized protein n=1 Tax=Arthrobotrys musiformis TaxID=47236 RepID=A0AAV9W0V3_9PEZI